MTAAQDPDELFDVVTFLGEPTGETKRRADVHRDGDWHRAIHIWFLSEIDGIPSIIFQRRSMAKDTLPGVLDVTVGGHLSAGETLDEAFREAEEEIGAVVTPEMAVLVGRRVGIGEHTAGVIDRELQDVYFVKDDRPLCDYRPNPIEVSELVRVAIDNLLDVLAGYRESAPVEILLVEDLTSTAGKVALVDFPPLVDRYLYRVAIAARAMLTGELHLSI